MTTAGIVLLAFAVLSLMIGLVFLTDIPVFVGVGVVLLIIGVLLLITELLENLLTKGQTALVDGLQAG
jgi:hypothetical protein